MRGNHTVWKKLLLQTENMDLKSCGGRGGRGGRVVRFNRMGGGLGSGDELSVGEARRWKALGKARIQGASLVA